MLYPSLGALSMVVAARLPVAPPLLMGAMGVLSTFDMSSANIRPVTSAKPPAGKATTISMGREGYFSSDQDRVVTGQSVIHTRNANLLCNRVIFYSPFRIRNRRYLWAA